MRNYVKILSWVLTIYWIFWAVPTLANSPKVKILKQGQKAPTDGVFYSKQAHAELVAKIQTQEEKCKLSVQNAINKTKIKADEKIAKLRINLKIETQKLDLHKKAMSTQKKILLAGYPKQKKQSWWKSSTFVFWSGVVTGILTTGLAVWGATKMVRAD